MAATEPPRETAAPTPLPTPMPIIGTAAPVSSTITYNCGDGSQSIGDSFSGQSPPSIDLSFDYELHNDLDVAVSQALQEIKQSILSDVATRLGCTEASQRRLQGTSGNVVGLMASRSDMPDPNAAGCLVEVDINEPVACTPTKGEMTVFAEPGSSEDDLLNMSGYIKDTIKDSMDAGRYESNTVKRVTWIGDRDLYLEELNPSPPVAIQTEPDDTGIDWMKIAMYSLAGVCAFLLCLLCMIIPTRRKSPTHDEELAMVEYMKAHRESRYKGHSMEPHNAIQRRSEHLRAVQQGRPLQAPYGLENGATSESSDDDDDSYFRRRHSGNRRHSGHHELAALPAPPVQRRDSRERNQIVSAPPQPPMIIGETGHFFVKDPSDAIAETEQPPQIEYQPQRGGGVESIHGNASSNEEEEKPTVRPTRHRHTVIETHDPRANAERRQRRTRETWPAPRTNANEMTKEERQRRIERARSNRKSLG